MSWAWTATTWIGAHTVGIATAAAAGFTAWMALLTRRGIEQNREQHRDTYRPMLVCAPTFGTAQEARNVAVRIIPGRPQNLGFFGKIRNIGVGPAIRGRMILRVRGLDQLGPDPLDLPALAAGESLHEDSDYLQFPTIDRKYVFNGVDVQLAPNEHWEIVLEYEDVFGRIFHTIHSKNSMSPWTIIGIGPAPKGRDPRLDAAIFQAQPQTQVHDVY